MSQRVMRIFQKMGAAALISVSLSGLTAGALTSSAKAADLSDQSVTVLMNYAWQILPKKFTLPSGKVIEVDKTKRDAVMIPTDIARDIIKVARLSAHAQICKLNDKQIENYQTMMKRESDKKKWSEQQMLYISQLHLFTVMWLTGNVQIVDQDGEKKVVVEDRKDTDQTCTDEQKAKVDEQISAYVKGSS